MRKLLSKLEIMNPVWQVGAAILGLVIVFMIGSILGEIL